MGYKKFFQGGPSIMDSGELEHDIQQARLLLDEEASRSQSRGGHQGEGQLGRKQVLADEDISVLRRKHPFLAEFSDNFIRNTPIGDLMKIQSTAMKAGELEKAKDVDDRLAVNKSALASTFTTVRLNSFLIDYLSNFECKF
jgi:hypothetical protein